MEAWNDHRSTDWTRWRRRNAAHRVKELVQRWWAGSQTINSDCSHIGRHGRDSDVRKLQQWWHHGDTACTNTKGCISIRRLKIGSRHKLLLVCSEVQSNIQAPIPKIFKLSFENVNHGRSLNHSASCEKAWKNLILIENGDVNSIACNEGWKLMSLDSIKSIW